MYSTKNKRKEIMILKKIMFVLFLGLQLVFVSSCKNESDKAHLSVRMTDAPANYDAVNIDVQSVEITGSTGTIVILNTNNRVYNLLNLSNGVDTLLATGDFDAGKISQIRLILGTNNSVTVDGVVYPLNTPSAMQSGLKLKVDKTFEAGVTYSILLDFDASQSIVVQGNGSYQLKPVIRTIETALNGSIKGSISILGTIATVSAVSNGVTYSSVTNANGQFLIAGLPVGTYNVTITPDLPWLPVIKSNIAVTLGASTNLGIITL